MSDGQERTEQATQQRMKEVRSKGQLSKSMDLTAWLGVAAGGLALPIVIAESSDVTSALVIELQTVMDNPEPAVAAELLGTALSAVLPVLTPMFVAVVVAIVIGTGVQGGIHLKKFQLHGEGLKMLPGLKRILGPQGLMELVKSLLKLAIVGWAVYGVLSAAWQDIAALGQEGPMALLAVVRKYSVGMLRNAGLAYLALAGLDYGFQIWQHQKSLRMTKEEVKQEHKNSEGDPMVKSRMRALARQRARQQMFRDVPKADVVLVNPVHIAVALRYDPEKAPAPIVVAAGRRKVAERIKALAFESEVPVVENVPLARALIASVKVGMMIPAELYLAVAEVLAYVMRQKGARGAAA